jgi:hypothetical protein
LARPNRAKFVYYVFLYDFFVRGQQAQNVCHPHMVT